MYSYEQRKKAVEFYIEYDKSASKVVREHGYTPLKIFKKEFGLENFSIKLLEAC